MDELIHYMQQNHTVVVKKLSQCMDEVHSFIECHPTVNENYFENVGTPNAYYTTNRNEILSRKFPYFSLMILRSQE